MLALKKKREAEQKAVADAAAAPKEVPETDATNETGSDNNTNGGNSNNNKVSLLGIGGVKKGNATSSNAQKKRTPGEIRIQKGV